MIGFTAQNSDLVIIVKYNPFKLNAYVSYKYNGTKLVGYHFNQLEVHKLNP